MRLFSRPRRPGFTLIELLVVIGIIGFLLAITAVFYPSYSASSQSEQSASSLSGWLLIAKQRARRDGTPTGLRLTVDPTTKFCNTLNYIQQPDPVASGVLTATNVAGYTATITTSSSLTGGNFQVQVGDYLEISGGGATHRITAISQTGSTVTVTVDSTGVPLPDLTNFSPAAGSPPNYRILRQPQPIPGEPPLQLKGSVVIDFNPSPLNNNNPLSLNVPVRSGNYEILFGPSGAVVGQGTGSGQIYFWVRDGSADISNSLTAGYPILISVQPRTGFIAANPVASTTGDPYLFTRDGRNSGM